MEPIDEEFLEYASKGRFMSILPLYTEDLEIIGTML